MVAARVSTADFSGELELVTTSEVRVEPGRVFPAVGQRDRRTLEISQVFPLPRESQADYSLDAYFYLPRGFGLSSSTFGGDAFYRNARVYLRLTAPDLTMRDLADLEHPHSPAAVLRRQIPLLLDDEPPSSASLNALAQMYGAELADAVRREANKLLGRLRGDKKKRQRSVELAHRVDTFCDDATAAFHTLRRVRAKARAYQGVADESLFHSLAFAEEYATSVLDEQLSRIGMAIDGSTVLHDGTGSALRARLQVAGVAEEINRRRLDAGFAVPWGKSPEYYSYRISLLKKELQRALYIDTRQTGADPYIRNSAAAIAAGLAATWAAIAQVPLVTGSWSSSQGLFLVGAFVFAYVLKDRIKEWTKNRLTARWSRWDHDRKIRGDALANVGLGAVVGRAREKVNWLNDDAIPADVHRLRRTRRTVKGTTPELEEVMHWRRRISFEPESGSVPEGFALQETFRLSLVDMLRRLDDPKDQVEFYDRQTGTFASRVMPRVYHLNAILVSTENITGMRRATRYRVVVNRKGIKRIDHVADLEGLGEGVYGLA